MTTLTVTIDERSRQKFGVIGRAISFEELRQRIIGEEALSTLRKTNHAARKAGLHKLSKKEIENEIKSARNGSRGS